MKLRNKKTGEIIEAESCNNTGGCISIYYEEKDGQIGTKDCYTSLAELNAEWEDYEEPKEHWFIDYDGGIIPFNRNKETATDNLMKQIGNYFDSREEAEKAVEKLKAWKRLKDKGFRFTDDFVYGEYYGCGSIRFIIFPSKKEKYVKDDLELLFGGEE